MLPGEKRRKWNLAFSTLIVGYAPKGGEIHENLIHTVISHKPE